MPMLFSQVQKSNGVNMLKYRSLHSHAQDGSEKIIFETTKDKT